MSNTIQIDYRLLGLSLSVSSTDKCLANNSHGYAESYTPVRSVNILQLRCLFATLQPSLPNTEDPK